MIFRAGLHIPGVFNIYDSMRIGGLCEFALLEHEQTMRLGLQYIYDLTDHSWSKFCLADEKILMDTYQNRFPARFARICITNPVWWVRAAPMNGFCSKLMPCLQIQALFAVMAPFLKQKLRERMVITPVEQLPEIFEPDMLPDFLGGTFVHSYDDLAKTVTDTAASYAKYQRDHLASRP